MIWAEDIGWVECALNFTNHRKTLEFVDCSCQIWAMLLQNIRTESVISLDLNFIGLWADEICQAVAHVACAGLGKS